MSATDGNLPAQPARPSHEASATAEAVALGIAQEKQYIGAAMAVCAMYTLGYVPGLIFNILWLREARRTALPH